MHSPQRPQAPPDARLSGCSPSCRLHGLTTPADRLDRGRANDLSRLMIANRYRLPIVAVDIDYSRNKGPEADATSRPLSTIRHAPAPLDHEPQPKGVPELRNAF